MSFCIIARCERTASLGVGVASESLAIGAQCDGAVRSRIGASLTLGALRPANNRLALRLLEQGYTPQYVLAELRANDLEHARRLIAVIDREGRGACECGEQVPAGAAASSGKDCVALIDGEPGAVLTRALIERFECDAVAALDQRILASLEAAAALGGLALRSVALTVFGVKDYSDADLRVDMHENPIAELRRLYDEYQPFAVYYDERARNPRQALPQREFADLLERSRRTAS